MEIGNLAVVSIFLLKMELDQGFFPPPGEDIMWHQEEVGHKKYCAQELREYPGEEGERGGTAAGFMHMCKKRQLLLQIWKYG